MCVLKLECYPLDKINLHYEIPLKAKTENVLVSSLSVGIFLGCSIISSRTERERSKRLIKEKEHTEIACDEQVKFLDLVNDGEKHCVAAFMGLLWFGMAWLQHWHHPD